MAVHSGIVRRMVQAISDMSSIFFFSSRRRHTRFKCDWSSDVCSSDLEKTGIGDSGRLSGPFCLKRILTINNVGKSPLDSDEPRTQHFAVGTGRFKGAEDRKSVV